MKTYCKIKTDKTIQMMPNIYKASWDLRNDAEGQIFCAKRGGWFSYLSIVLKREKILKKRNFYNGSSFLKLDSEFDL